MFNQYESLSTPVIIFYIMIAILPAAMLMVYIYRNDSKEKESPLLLLKCIFGGILAVAIAIVLELISDRIVIYLLTIIFQPTQMNYGILTALFVGLIEEGAKLFFLYRFTWKNKEFNYRFDGIVYAVFVSLGFAALENVFYVFNTQSIAVAAQRALLTIPGHMSFAVYMGLYYGQAKVAEAQGNQEARNLTLGAAFAFPAILHAIFDGTLMVNEILGLVIFFIFIIILDIVVFRTIQLESKSDALINPPAYDDIYRNTSLNQPNPIVEEVHDETSTSEKM